MDPRSWKTWAVVGAALLALGLAFVVGRTTAPGGDAGDGGTGDGGGEATATTWTCAMHAQIQLPKPGKCPI